MEIFTDTIEARSVAYVFISILILLTTISFNLPPQLGNCLFEAGRNYYLYFLCKDIVLVFVGITGYLITKCCSERIAILNTKRFWSCILFFLSLFWMPDCPFVYQLSCGCDKKSNDHKFMVSVSCAAAAFEVIAFVTLIWSWRSKCTPSVCMRKGNNSGKGVIIPRGNPDKDTIIPIEQSAQLMENNDSGEPQ